MPYYVNSTTPADFDFMVLTDHPLFQPTNAEGIIFIPIRVTRMNKDTVSTSFKVQFDNKNKTTASMTIKNFVFGKPTGVQSIELK